MPDYYLSLTTPLGDALTLLGYRGEEGLSRLFEFELDLGSSKPDLEFSLLVGQSVTVEIAQTSSAKRYINGIVRRLSLVQLTDEKSAEFRAIVVPTLWTLGLNADCRIFQNKTAVDIIKQVLQDNKVTDIRDALSGSYRTRDYCVQYRESALAFVSRLMEEEGIFYFFEHKDGQHTLVLADDSSVHENVPGTSTLSFVGHSSQRIYDDVIHDVGYEEQLVTEGVALDDYNFTTPSTDLAATSGKTDKPTQVFDYPGRYTQKSDGESLSKAWLEGLETPAKEISGRGKTRTLIAGYKLTLKDHPRSALNDSYVITELVLSGSQEAYDNSFRAIPADTPFRPVHRTPKPKIAGSQTAAVVGSSGEEIYTDQYGRVKVQFPWDREGENNEKSSCWIRVAQGWSGKGWGTWFLPRIGMEVVVSFLEGDPDRPLITGCVYNAEQTLPYTLPDKMTTSTLLSRSSKEGDAGNELRFDDTKDSEELYIHAQKDMTVEIENDRNETLNKGSDSLTITEGDRTISVEKGKETHTVKDTRDVTVEGKETHTNKDEYSHEVTGKETHTNKDEYSHEATGNYTLKTDGELSITAGQKISVQSQGGITMQASGSMSVQSGGAFSISSGSSLSLQAGSSLSVQASSSASIQSGGVLSLTGSMVKVG